jgi:hypothetical protein
VLGVGSALLNTSNNTSNVAVVSGAQPSGAGVLNVEVTAGPGNTNGSKFYYLGAIELSYVPEPASILLLLVSFVGLGVHRPSCLS